MLQLNSQAGRQAVSLQDGEGRAAGFAQGALPMPAALGDGRARQAGEPASFAEVQALELEQVGHGSDVPPAEQGTPALAQDMPQDAGGKALLAPDAEQWLRSMLDQQGARIEARDGGAGEAHALAAGEHLEPLAGLGNAAAGRQQLNRTQVAAGERLGPLAGLDGTAAGQRQNMQDLRLPQADAGAHGEARRPSLTGELAERLPARQGMAANPSLALGRGLPPTVGLPTPTQALAGPPGAEAMAAALPGNGAESPAGQVLAQLERLPGESGIAPVSTSAANAGQMTQAPLLEQRLELQAPQAKWGEQMLQALRESVEVQLQQRVQHATIRLDPPELGSLEIFLSHESGRLNVQISAAQGDVARLLQHTSERLRQELVGQNFLQVSVQVSADGQSGQQHARHGRARPFDEEPVMAGAPQAEPPTTEAGRPDDVLITV